jgi:hydrogenase/urease accessory protein HupE
MGKYLNKIIVCALFLAWATVTALADEYRPAYLELTQTDADTYDVLWKVPARGSDKRLGIHIVFTEDVETVFPVRSTFVGGAFIDSSTIRRSGGLSEAEIRIDGLSTISTEVLVRIERLDGTTEVARLTSASPSFTVAAVPRFWEVVKTYLVFGVQHIWSGRDHLLFVACLILIAGTWRRILITITGFTVAHSITLSLAALALVQVPVPPIEAVIALSIVFLAREIASERRDTLTWRYPIAVSSTFGLLHGFGFASALREIGLPQTEIPAALASFNIGVEIGQIVFVSVVIGGVWSVTMLLRNAGEWSGEIIQPIDWLRRIEKPISYVVGGITVMWTVERITAFWG